MSVVIPLPAFVPVH